MNKSTMSKSLEDYLESIYRLKLETGASRVVDVAKALKVTMPSVNNAVKELAALGYVNYEKYHELQLTPSGTVAAKKVYDLHRLLKGFLLKIGVSEANAEEDACSMEHILSQETIARLQALMADPEILAKGN